MFVFFSVTYESLVRDKKPVKIKANMSKRFVELRSDPMVSACDLLEAIKLKNEFSVDLDMVSVEVRCFDGKSSVDDFLANIPVGDVINVVKRRDWRVSSEMLPFCYINSVDSDSEVLDVGVFKLD